jgi:hypothetical protein
MFLWTMVLPLPVTEKEDQSKPCGLVPDVLAQGAAVPAGVVQNSVRGGLRRELPALVS